MRWNNEMIEERRRLNLPTINLDWDTATYLYNEGVPPTEAARRLKTKA